MMAKATQGWSLASSLTSGESARCGAGAARRRPNSLEAGVMRPSSTPASVGWSPARSMPIQTCDLSYPIDRWSGDRLGQIEVLRLLKNTEILRREEFLKADDL